MADAPTLSCDICLWFATDSPAEYLGYAYDQKGYQLCSFHAFDSCVRLKSVSRLSQAQTTYRLTRPDWYKRFRS